MNNKTYQYGDLISVEEEKRARSTFKSSRTSRGRERKIEKIHPLSRTGWDCGRRETEEDKHRRRHQLRRCRGRPRGRDTVTENRRCPCISRSARHDGSMLLPSRPSPSVRSRETVFPGDRDRVRPPSRILHIRMTRVPEWVNEIILSWHA